MNKHSFLTEISPKEAKNKASNLFSFAVVRLAVLAALCLATNVAAQTENNVPYIDENGVTQTANGVTVISSENIATVNNLNGWYLVRGTLSRTSTLKVSGTAHIILEDDCNLTVVVNSESYGAGINVSASNRLTIYAQSADNNMGKLTATGGVSSAGIGGSGFYYFNGNAVEDGGTITINGGNVTAISGRSCGAGIGGGASMTPSNGGSGGTITINGGTVTATSTDGAGIGGGCGSGAFNSNTGTDGRVSGGSGGTITINGGTVTATGSSAGIGGGSAANLNGWDGTYDNRGGSGGTITINGGTVTATATEGAGIGGAIGGTAGTFTMNGNAIVFASSVRDMSSGNKTYGILVVNNTTTYLYGLNQNGKDMTLPINRTLPLNEGQILTIPSGITLTNNGIIINYGEIRINGTLTNNNGIINIGTIIGTVNGNSPITINNINLSSDIPSFTTDNWTFANNVYTILDGASVTITGTSAKQRRIQVAANATANITLNGVTIEGLGSNQYPFLLNSSTNVTLTLTGTNTFTAGSGIQVSESTKLTITGTGSLSTNGTAIYLSGSTTLNVIGGTLNATGTAISNASTGVITVSNPAIITSQNTSTSSGAIYLANSGTETAARLIITGGTVKNISTGTSGNAIYNASVGAVNISGGTIEAAATSGRAIHNVSTGTVNISGGTIETAGTSGNAIYNASTGVITVSNPAIITSQNTSASSGTIYLANSGTETVARLIIAGGTVKNISTGTSGNAIYNASTGIVNISSGTIETAATSGRAIYNTSTGTVNISYGTIEATGSSGNAIYNGSGTVNISGGIIEAAGSSGNAIYNGSGTITVSQTNYDISTMITSANTSTSSGTIYLVGGTLTITGGAVKNIATGTSGGYAIYNASTSTVNVSGGTIEAAGQFGRAIHNAYSGIITISGTATITSANVAANQGVIYNNAGGIIEIYGGTVTNTSGGNAVYLYSENGLLVLGGSPKVTGNIRVLIGATSVITEGTNTFAPAEKQYTLTLGGTVNLGSIAVINGAAYANNFMLTNDGFDLTVGGTNLVVMSVPTYTVTFMDWDGTVLKTQTVNQGSSATAPAEPTRASYIFIGWDKTFHNITSPLTVTAEYEVIPPPTIYIVKFEDWNGEVLKFEEVEHGSSATAPENPTRAGYTFTGWDKAFSNVTDHLTVRALYEASSPIINSIASSGFGIALNGQSFQIVGTSQATPIRIYNLRGNVVMSRTAMPNESISVSHLPKGMYLIQARFGKGVAGNASTVETLRLAVH